MNLNGGARSVVPPAPIPASTERRPPSPGSWSRYVSKNWKTPLSMYPRGYAICVQRPTAFPKPSPGQRPGKPHPKNPSRPEGADQPTGALDPPFQGGCDDRFAVPRALPSAGFGHALRAIRFRVAMPTLPKGRCARLGWLTAKPTRLEP